MSAAVLTIDSLVARPGPISPRESKRRRRSGQQRDTAARSTRAARGHGDILSRFTTVTRSFATNHKDPGMLLSHSLLKKSSLPIHVSFIVPRSGGGGGAEETPQTEVTTFRKLSLPLGRSSPAARTRSISRDGPRGRAHCHVEAERRDVVVVVVGD